MTYLARVWHKGIAEGYPRCCVAEFVMDLAKGHLPARLRGTTGPDGWVPCDQCKKT